MQAAILLLCCLALVDGGNLWTHKEFDPHNYRNGMHALTSNDYDHGSGSVVTDPNGGHNHVLRVWYEKGRYSSHGPNEGVQFFATPTSHRTVMTFSYDLYFDKNFDFRRGGKLPGLFGGWTNCSGGRHSDNCFSTRFMWRADGDGEVYGYIPDYHHQVSHFCDHNVCNSVKGYSMGRGNWRFKRGTWQNIAQSVHLNTPGKTDGSIKVWHDGKLVYTIDHLNIRSKSINIDGIFFSTFFGGSDSSWAPTRDCYSYFKNFVLSTDTSHPSIVG
ncbi:uncharacterized protein LOC124256290 [Haliotis rubra]|uniref:uncharacterized protein LOC124256290 n=1 Tax=Haliotis rubra TaxID=36100 RepID=UPI001EE5C0EB|nr:uncharacterized protein LOC124256290 [Haliotis rubra]XP_046546221.1 uncharacterized protein LOC124256290 [Haliotis rubra]